MPCASVPTRPDDAFTMSLPKEARTSVPVPQVPEVDVQIPIGVESDGNDVTPGTAVQTLVQTNVKLCPTVKDPKDVTYTKAVPVPPCRVAVAGLVIA